MSRWLETQGPIVSVGGIFLKLTIDHHDHMTISAWVKNPSELRSFNFIQYVQVISVKKDINEKKISEMSIQTFNIEISNLIRSWTQQGQQKQTRSAGCLGRHFDSK